MTLRAVPVMLAVVPDLRAEISGRMRSQVDGLGAQRIARRVDDLLAGIT